MKNKILIIISLLFQTSANKLLAQAQNCSACTNSGNAQYWCVSTATDLMHALDPGYTGHIEGDPFQQGIVDICGTINLGDLDPDKFPLVVPDHVTLQGNFNFYNYNSGGTTINFHFYTKTV